LRRKIIVTLLTLGPVFLAVTGCAESDQSSEDDTNNQNTVGETQAKESGSGNTNGKAGGRKAKLALQGGSGTEFSGSCTVGDQEPEEIGGQLPTSYTYRLRGEPLDCEITSDGDVQVELTVDKNVRSVQRISGGTLHLTYKNGSISSTTSSSGTSSQASSTSSRGDTAGGSSSVTSESRDVSGFDEVELDGVGNLSIQQTGSESLSVEAEEDVLPKLRTEVKGNRLIIAPEPNTTISTTRPINYELTVKDLSALDVSGSGNVDAEDISTDDLTINVGGTGDVKISGKVESQDVEVSGSGDYQAGDLESQDAKVDVGGSGSALVNVSNELDASASGSGSVEYIGDPTVNQDVSGSGEVRAH
jgi:Putative auto-transporter adhesin, head GIN domain